MRVALLTNFVPPYRVPVFRALREQVGELRVLISAAMERNRPWTPHWADLDVVVQRTWTLQRTWTHERFREAYELHVPYDTIPQLMRFRPDAIVTGEFGLRTAQAITYAKLARIPVVIWATIADHLEESRGRVRAVARRVLVRAADRVIVNGASGARYIRSLGGAEERTVRIPQAVELGAFTSIPLERAPGTARRLLFCGSLTERKGLDLLLAATSIWSERNPGRTLSLAIVGDGPERARLQALPTAPAVAIEWVGAVDYDQLAAWYARCGVFVYPTRGDEWGLVVNEAMAAGLPVIGSLYSQAVEDLVEEARNGWRFRPDDAEAVATAIERALATPDDELAAMRARARATATHIAPEWVAASIAVVLRDARG